MKYYILDCRFINAFFCFSDTAIGGQGQGRGCQGRGCQGHTAISCRGGRSGQSTRKTGTLWFALCDCPRVMWLSKIYSCDSTDIVWLSKWFASSMFSFVFQSHISLDCDEGIPPSDAKVIPPSDVKVIPPSDVKVNSQQEKQVLCDLLCVTVTELCDCPRSPY